MQWFHLDNTLPWPLVLTIYLVSWSLLLSQNFFNFIWWNMSFCPCISFHNVNLYSNVLFYSTGAVIGRQILDLKCCKCPSRDLLNEDKTALRNREHALQSHHHGDHMQVSLWISYELPPVAVFIYPNSYNPSPNLADPFQYHEQQRLINCRFCGAHLLIILNFINGKLDISKWQKYQMMWSLVEGELNHIHSFDDLVNKSVHGK